MIMRILNPLRSAARIYPLGTAVAIQLLVLGLFLWSVASYGTVNGTNAAGQPDISWVLLGLTTESIVAAALVALVWLLGWLKACRLTTRQDWKGVKWAAPLVGIVALFGLSVITLLLAVGTLPDQGTVVVKLALFCLAVAVFEETLFRGTLFHGLSQRFSPFTAMIGSSVVFGMFHMQNLVVGQAFDATAFQSLNAFALGVVFCAVMLQTNSIWWAVALHLVWNLFLFVSAYLAQTQPELIGMTADEFASQPTSITATAFLMPLVLLSIGLLIYARWAKRVRTAT